MVFWLYYQVLVKYWVDYSRLYLTIILLVLRLIRSNYHPTIFGWQGQNPDLIHDLILKPNVQISDIYCTSPNCLSLVQTILVISDRLLNYPRCILFMRNQNRPWTIGPVQHKPVQLLLLAKITIREKSIELTLQVLRIKGLTWLHQGFSFSSFQQKT